MTGAPHLIPTRGALKAWIDLYGPTTEAPDEAHLAAALSLFSVAIGWKAHVKWAENSEPCTINVLLEGRSAIARKTTVASTSQALARAAMKDLPKDTAQLRFRNLSHTSDRGLIEAVAPSTEEMAERWEKEPPPGTQFVWDEFGAVLGKPGDLKGADWLGRVRTTIMQLTNGRHAGIQTGQSKIPPARCAASILATMTRVELEERASTGLLRDGFLGRFVMVPHNGRQSYLSEPPAWNPAMTQAKGELTTWIRNLAQSKDEIGNVFDRLEPDARARRVEWYEDNSRRLDALVEANPTESNLACAEAFGRLQTTAIKVALIAAIASRWNSSHNLSDTRITREDVDYGIQFADYAIAEIQSLSAGADTGPLDAYGERAVSYVTKHGPVPKKKLLDECRMGNLSRETRWRIIEQLHPDTLEIHRVDTNGRPRLDVALAE